MTSPVTLQMPLELARSRRSLFAVQLLDAVTLQRVSDGIDVVAEGLRRKPIVNRGGVFVWLDEDVTQLTKLSIRTGALPYEGVDVAPASLQVPPAITTIELVPTPNYTFTSGMTVARGTLLEDRRSATPVANAEVHLEWLDSDGVTWHDAPTRSHTTVRGDFVSILRLSAADAPDETNGALTVQLRVRRDGNPERRSAKVMLARGRVADPTSMPALIFAWNELQP